MGQKKSRIRNASSFLESKQNRTKNNTSTEVSTRPVLVFPCGAVMTAASRGRWWLQGAEAAKTQRKGGEGRAGVRDVTLPPWDVTLPAWDVTACSRMSHNCPMMSQLAL